MGKEDIKKHEFKPGQSGNPNGRPKKIFSTINKQLMDEGYEAVTPGNMIESFKFLLGLDEPRLLEMIADKEQPMLIRIMAKEMMGKKGADILEKLMDRAYGRTKSYLDVSTNGESMNRLPDMSKWTHKQLHDFIYGSGNNSAAGDTSGTDSDK